MGGKPGDRGSKSFIDMTIPPLIVNVATPFDRMGPISLPDPGSAFASPITALAVAASPCVAPALSAELAVVPDLLTSPVSLSIPAPPATPPTPSLPPPAPTAPGTPSEHAPKRPDLPRPHITKPKPAGPPPSPPTPKPDAMRSAGTMSAPAATTGTGADGTEPGDTASATAEIASPKTTPVAAMVFPSPPPMRASAATATGVVSVPAVPRKPEHLRPATTDSRGRGSSDEAVAAAAAVRAAFSPGPKRTQRDHVAHEIFSTEETFVKCLRVLVDVCRPFPSLVFQTIVFIVCSYFEVSLFSCHIVTR